MEKLLSSKLGAHLLDFFYALRGVHDAEQMINSHACREIG